MKPGPFVTLTMVKHEKIAYCSLPFGGYPIGWAAAKALYQSQSIACQMKPMDFFVWQGGRGVNSQAVDDDSNAARRKKTRFHGTLWVGIGITSSVCRDRIAATGKKPTPGKRGLYRGHLRRAQRSGQSCWAKRARAPHEQAPAAGIMQRGRTAASSEPRQIRRSANRTRCQRRGRTGTLPVPGCPRASC